MEQIDLKCVALGEYYKQIDELKTRNLGYEINETNAPLFEGLIALLGRYYGHSKETMIGDPDSYLPEKRFNHIRPLVCSWKAQKRKDKKYPGKDPYQVLNALRKLPTVCARYPTEYEFTLAIRGEKIKELSFGEMPRLDPKSPWEELAKQWEAANVNSKWQALSDSEKGKYRWSQFWDLWKKTVKD